MEWSGSECWGKSFMRKGSIADRVLLATLMSFAVWGCGSGEDGSVDGKPPGCRPLFEAAGNPDRYVQLENGIVLLYPEEGMRLGTAEGYLVEGRAFGDFSGGIEINGVPAEVVGNGFHRTVPDPGVETLDIDIVARGSDGKVTASLQRSVSIDTTVNYSNGVALTWHAFRPATSLDTFRDLLKGSCAERLIFLLWHSKTPSSEMQAAIREKGLFNLGFLHRARIVVADRDAIMSLTDQFLDDAGILWMGPLVSQMKYHLGLFDGLTDIDLDTLQLGQSIAGVPAVTFGGSPETADDVAALVGLMEDHAVWHQSMSDEFVRAVLELEALHWILQEPLVQYVESITPQCPDCEGCFCDTSACATAGVICPVLFGEDAICRNESCELP